MMDGRHIAILLPISILTYSVCVIIRMSCCFRLQNFVVIGETWQDGGRRVGNLLLCSGLVTAFIQNGENLYAYQIRMIYLNPMSR